MFSCFLLFEIAALLTAVRFVDVVVVVMLLIVLVVIIAFCPDRTTSVSLGSTNSNPEDVSLAGLATDVILLNAAPGQLSHIFTL